jgi:hypothetical protein
MQMGDRTTVFEISAKRFIHSTQQRIQTQYISCGHQVKVQPQQRITMAIQF